MVGSVSVATIALAGTLLAVDSDRPAAGTPAPARESTRTADAAESAGEPETSGEFLAWIDLCVERIGSSDGKVRAGAAQALRTAGADAVPALESAVESDNPQRSTLAERVLAQIDRQTRGSQPGSHQASVHRPGSASRVLQKLELDDAKTEVAGMILEDFERRQREIVAGRHEGNVDRAEIARQLATLRREADARLAEFLDEAEMERYRELTNARGRSAD
jgi:hypothetical protein